MTYSESIQLLYQLRLFGTKLGLEQTLELAALAGNPQAGLRFIHVAGTNGKGSTCAMLESIYRAAGLRVGLFTSPHLVSFRERIQIDRQLISPEDVIRLVDRAQSWLRAFPADAHPTFFEVVVVLALCYFRERQCDLVIWETGLGGRLDATNIVTPLVSVITNIQHDHERWLGSTLAQIAAEKAGIIKPHVPVLTAAEEPEAVDVIVRTARQQLAPLTRITAADGHRPPLDRLEIPLLGEHQRTNAALALATTQVLTALLPLPPGAAENGLKAISWPGRLHRHVTPEGGIWLLDGAHNPAGSATLRTALQQYFPGRRPTLILGVMRDKDWPAMCAMLAPLAARILLVPVHSERTAAPSELEDACVRIDPAIKSQPCRSLSEALIEAKLDPFVVITGSLHLVGEAMELLGLLPGTSERDLNDWDSFGPDRGSARRHP